MTYETTEPTVPSKDCPSAVISSSLQQVEKILFSPSGKLVNFGGLRQPQFQSRKTEV
jgi:hypothetical protein